ncbi:MAG TPA: hypothetical protein VNZ53_19345 [Steroidobacteraceae bacterium]|nr:hypothetical protein [Steroidobacteraceae bacterium]
MTIFGTPGGTPLNTTPFQGTAPGNAAQATLPGIPPNMSVLAAISAGLLPINALMTNYGQKHHPTAGRTVMDGLVDVDNGVSAVFVQNGGSAHAESNGGSGLGAGGHSQEQGVGQGCGDQLPANAPTGAPALQFPTTSNATGGTPPTLGSLVQYGG